MMKIGIRLESLGLPLRRGLQIAEELGVAGVQVDAVGELAPGKLSQTGRRDLRRLVGSHNLELSALGCPIRHGLNVPEGLEPRMEYVRQVLALCAELGASGVVVEAGPVAEGGDFAAPANRFLRESLLALGQHGDRVGAVLALETGLESGETLARFLGNFDTGSLAANLDPANLVIHGFDPYAAVAALASRIVHTHIKDARKAGASRTAALVPLGHGDIDWLQFLDRLEEVDYRSWLTIEKERGTLSAAEASAAVGFLHRLVRA